MCSEYCRGFTGQVADFVCGRTPHVVGYKATSVQRLHGKTRSMVMDCQGTADPLGPSSPEVLATPWPCL